MNFDFDFAEAEREYWDRMNCDGEDVENDGCVNYDDESSEEEENVSAAGWVSCENSLPESEGEYLIYNIANVSQTVQYFDGRVWGYFVTVKPDVTHWTKLPPAPACR